MSNPKQNSSVEQHDDRSSVTEDEVDLPLFRREAIRHNEVKWLGEVVFSQPLALKAVVVFAVVVVIVTALFVYMYTYTKKGTAVGMIMPESGVIPVYSHVSGHVVQSNVAEGKRVKKGDVLFVISAESTWNQSVVAEQNADYEAIKKLLASEIVTTRKLQFSDFKHIRETMKNSIRTIKILDEMIAIQEKRVAAAEQTEENLKRGFLARKQVSEATVAAKEADVLDQQSRLASLEENRSTEQRNLEGARSDLEELPLRSQNTIADYERLYHSANSSLAEIEGPQEASVIAPASGVITDVNVSPGSGVDLKRPLLSIIPDSSRLEAILYASDKDIRFIKSGDSIRLQCDAFPNSQPEPLDGKIVSISIGAPPPSEFSSVGELIMKKIGPHGQGVPMYRIDVALKKRFFIANGRHEDLKPRMIVEAEIIEETRRLYQWALEPNYAMNENQ